jgi:hypothetical protein
VATTSGTPINTKPAVQTPPSSATGLPLVTDPMDVALAPDGDILIDAEGLHFVSGMAAVVQGVQIRLLLFFKEWFLNQDVGVHYFEELIGDASKSAGVEDRARAAFAAAILDTPGVTAILQLDVVIDANARTMSVTWQAQCAFGDTPVVTQPIPTS